MATSGASLQLKFGTMSGVKTWNFRYANQSVDEAKVKTLVTTMIENGSIYKYPPLTPESAQIVITSIKDFDVSGITATPN